MKLLNLKIFFLFSINIKLNLLILFINNNQKVLKLFKISILFINLNYIFKLLINFKRNINPYFIKNYS